PPSDASVVRASGGRLDVTANITATNVTQLQVDNGAAAILELDGTVAAGDRITFMGPAGALVLTQFSNPGTSNALLTGFNATVAGLTTIPSLTAPTGHSIDLARISPGSIASATLDTTTDIIKVTNAAGGSFNLQLSGSYASGTSVRWISDGG